MIMKVKTVLGVCAGNGVPLHPFLHDHFRIVGNVEPRAIYHTPKEEQWCANFNGIPLYRSLDKVEIDCNRVDIIIGNPKCGASSKLRFSRSKELGNPKEEPTINMFIESIIKYNPKLFLMENLPKLLDFITKEDFIAMFPGYELIFHEGSVSMWGNSQNSRKRLVIIGVQKKYLRIYLPQFIRIIPFKVMQHSRELLEALKFKENTNIELCNIREDPNFKVAMYDYRDGLKQSLTLKEIEDLWMGDFKNDKKWPIKSSKMSTLPGVYRNQPDAFPMTVRKENRQFHWNGLNHTPRELAIFQGIPMDFKLHMNLDNKNYWLNKSRATIAQSPPYEIGFWFRNQILKSKLNKKKKNQKEK